MIITPPYGLAKPGPWRGFSRLLIALLGVLFGAAEPHATSRTPLTENFKVEREIHSGESHVYSVELQAGQFLRVTVQEEAIDLIVRLASPSGQIVTSVDGLPTGEANEEMAHVATEAGSYELRIGTSARPGTGRYSLQVEALGEPHEEGGVLAEAVRRTWEACNDASLSKEDQIRSAKLALPLWRQVGSSRKEGEVLYCLGENHYKLGAYEQAAEVLQRSASLWSQQPSRRAKSLQTNILLDAGRSLRSVERPARAREVFAAALNLARELEDLGLQATSLDVLGKLDVAEGEVLKGLEQQQQALLLVRQTGDREKEGVILSNLAATYDQLSEMQKALDFNLQALELARRDQDRELETIYLNNLGAKYRSLGDWQKAFNRFREAAKLSEKYTQRRGMILINLASAYQHLGQLKEARRTFEQALTLGRRTNALNTQRFALANLALLLLQVKRPTEAAACAREAVGLGGSLEEENFSRLVLGKALRALGDNAAAQSELEKALALARQRGAQGTEAEIQLGLAGIARDGGDLPGALSRIQSAIELTELRRGRVVDPELRTSFLASKQDYYEFKIGTLMALHSREPSAHFGADALQASEQAHARGLLEILNEAGTDIRQGADAALLKRERELREEVNARDWYRRRLLAGDNPDSKRLENATQRLEEALEESGKIGVQLRESSPAYSALTQPQSLDVETIQRQILGGKALLLEYSLGTERSFLWAVTPDSVQSYPLPGRQSIETAARHYYAQLTARNVRLKGEDVPAMKLRVEKADAEAEKAGHELSQLILQPVRKLLAKQPLLIVADGALQYIPFAALPIPGSEAPLASRHQILSLPSASVLAVIRRELHDRSPAPIWLAIFADPVFQRDDERLRHPDAARRIRLTQKVPPRRGEMVEGRGGVVDVTKFRRLPASQKEANTIAELLPPGQVVKKQGFAASRAAVTNGMLDRYRNLHFATHGVLDSDHPALSGLVLSLYNERGEFQRDGFLRLNDVYNLRLNADLVVLSACQTALGKEIRGEGLVGLTRGFMYAGAARVLASLWSVEDRATAELMGRFYRGMLREGLTPAEALRRAQLEISRQLQWKSPYYWAGFSLQGEWR